MPETQLRDALCDASGQVHCPACGQHRAVEVMTAVRRDPLVACMWLSCGHAWHVELVGLMPVGRATACDCKC